MEDSWKTGKSVRTYRRSTIAPAIEIHRKENLRLEFKGLEMSRSITDYHGYFLLWLMLILDQGLMGRPTKQTRIYDLRQVAKNEIDAETVRTRAGEVLDRAPDVLARLGFDCRPLDFLRQRLTSNRLPANEIIDLFERHRSIPATLRELTELV